MSEDGGPAREAARRVLADVRAGAYADRAAARRLSRLHGRERALALELAYGTIRLRGRLDAELARRVDRPLAKLDPRLLDRLRLGLYQLRETRIPAHAAVNETVAGGRAELGRGAAGLLNAVLRSAAREGVPDGTFPDRALDPEGWLVAYGSHPAWLVRRWLARWPLADVERLVEYDNRPPSVTLRLLGGSSENTDVGPGARLETVPGRPRLRVLREGTPEEALAALRAVVQDPAASAVVDYVGPRIEGPVLDACAAPGGKAAALSDLAEGARPFVAADAGFERLRAAAPGLRRVAPEVALVAMDARRPAVRGARTVLVDAPCSGTGVLGRRPDARWRQGERRLASLVRLQAEILDACADLVPASGLLVYATCSLEREENEAQVDAFLDRWPQFERAGPGGPVAPGLLTDRGDLEALPFRTGTDGAFASRLRRKGEAG